MSSLEEMEIDIDNNSDPTKLAPWFEQFQKLSESKRRDIVSKVMIKVKAHKPETYEFIQKFKCEVVGVTPRVEYSLHKAGGEDLDVTWIHSFSGPTLLFWCKQGGFGFFVNPNLRYNDSVLNDIEGNKKQSLRGFTG